MWIRLLATNTRAAASKIGIQSCSSEIMGPPCIGFSAVPGSRYVTVNPKERLKRAAPGRLGGGTETKPAAAAALLDIMAISFKAGDAWSQAAAREERCGSVTDVPRALCGGATAHITPLLRPKPQ
jgi:hypothetical protein